MIRFLKCQQSKEWDIIYSTWCYRSQLWRILWLCWHHSGWFLIFCSADKLKYLPRFTAVPARVCPELPIFTTINSTAHAKTSVRTLLVYSKPREVQTAREATAERCCKGSWALTAHKNSRANRPITAKEHPLSCFIPSTSATNPVRKSADCSSRGRVNRADHRLQVYLAFSAVLYQFSQIKQRFFFFFPLVGNIFSAPKLPKFLQRLTVIVSAPLSRLQGCYRTACSDCKRDCSGQKRKPANAGQAF